MLVMFHVFTILTDSSSTHSSSNHGLSTHGSSPTVHLPTVHLLMVHLLIVHLLMVPCRHQYYIKIHHTELSILIQEPYRCWASTLVSFLKVLATLTTWPQWKLHIPLIIQQWNIKAR